MYAVVKTGGKQLKVEKDATAVVEKLDAEVGAVVELPVLLVSDGEKTHAGAAELSGAKVTAEVVEHFNDDKVVVFKFKKRKGYRRTRGHRQEKTLVRITEIEVAGKKAPKAQAKPAEEKP